MNRLQVAAAIRVHKLSVKLLPSPYPPAHTNQKVNKTKRNETKQIKLLLTCTENKR